MKTRRSKFDRARRLEKDQQAQRHRRVTQFYLEVVDSYLEEQVSRRPLRFDLFWSALEAYATGEPVSATDRADLMHSLSKGNCTPFDRRNEITGYWSRTKKGEIGPRSYFVPNKITWLNRCDLCGRLGRKSMVGRHLNKAPALFSCREADEEAILQLCMSCANKRNAINRRIDECLRLRLAISNLKKEIRDATVKA